MKRVIIIAVLLTLSGTCFSAKLIWPGVPYSTVKVFLYNTDNKLMGNHSPVKDGKLIPSIVDAGKTLSSSDLVFLQSWLASDLSLLQAGLSGCYIPHHAFVFYNDKNEIVAWMSTCFLCGGIRLYQPELKFKYPKSENLKASKAAEDHLNKLKDWVAELGIPVFNHLNDAETYHLKLNVKSTVAIELTHRNDALIDELFHLTISTSNFRELIADSSFDAYRSMKVTASGDKIYYNEYHYRKSTFIFSGSDKEVQKLESALIHDPQVKLFDFINVGMSRDEFMTVFKDYDGPENPDRIILRNDDNSKNIKVEFKDHIVISIEIIVASW